MIQRRARLSTPNRRITNRGRASFNSTVTPRDLSAPISQLAVTPLGNANIVIQIIGDRNVVNFGHAHLRLTRYLNRRAVRRELDWLSPYSLSTPWVGRERELEGMCRFLRRPQPVLARVLIGGAGRGKTRLALQLCEWAATHGWNAGFVSGTELTGFFRQAGTRTWMWLDPTLIVVDYAARYTRILASWIDELVDHTASGAPPLRIIFLERTASLESGWCSQIFSPGGYGDSHRLALLHPLKPVELIPLRTDEERLTLIEEFRKQVTPDKPGLTSEERRLLTLRFRNVKWAGDPLYMLMATLTGALEHPGEWTPRRADLAMELARRETRRVSELAEQKGLDWRLAVHLAACVTLCQGMSRQQFEPFAVQEKVWLQRPGGGDVAVLADLLQEGFPAPGGIAPLVPDMIGEAFALAHLQGPSGAETAVRCFRLAGTAVVQTLVRCAQDFSPRLRQPLQWLEALERTVADDAEALLAFQGELPNESPLFFKTNVRIARKLVALNPAKSGTRVSGRAESLARLAYFLLNAGRCDLALRPAEQSVDLYRDLARNDPDAYQLRHGSALVNLVMVYHRNGKRELALDIARHAKMILMGECERLHGRAFPLAPICLMEVLASILGETGQHTAAIAAAENAVKLWTAICAATTRFDCFRSYLALSLTTLARQLHAANRSGEALQHCQKAVDIYRELMAVEPHGYLSELASALNTLGGILIHIGRHEPAAVAAEEAVDHHRCLARLQRRVFQPSLATSLTYLATAQFHRGQHAVSLKLVQEALTLYRKMVSRSAKKVGPDLALLLVVWSFRCTVSGSRLLALRYSQEALRVLKSLGKPESSFVSRLFVTILREYVDYCAQIGIEPDLRRLNAQTTRMIQTLSK
jgi:tetratricopeptide (TPR) repeat protein